MRKLIAIINVIAWSGFWAFGYLAVTAKGLSPQQIWIATILASLGFLTGVIAYLKLSHGQQINNKALGYTHAGEES